MALYISFIGYMIPSAYTFNNVSKPQHMISLNISHNNATKIPELAARVVAKAIELDSIIATAESCTGGLLSSAITSVPGSSDMFDRGFVTYSNHAKAESLDVPLSLIMEHGAVSEEVAKAMAIGAARHSNANITIAITGVAGPGGGTEAKPVGLVWVAINFYDQIYTFQNFFSGDRENVRIQTVYFCLTELMRLLSNFR